MLFSEKNYLSTDGLFTELKKLYPFFLNSYQLKIGSEMLLSTPGSVCKPGLISIVLLVAIEESSNKVPTCTSLTLN